METDGLRDPATSVDEVLDLFARWGTHPYDETLPQLDHALQCAALARGAGAADELVAAALLHDVGHLLELDQTGSTAGGTDDTGETASDRRHEAVGARHLSALFGPKVTGPIALHVQAKRYLVATEPALLGELSEGSRASLVRQGGPLDDDGVARFAAHPGAADAISLRRWDDAAKVVGLDVPGLDDYAELLEQLAGRRRVTR